jgi:hypothetical protein
LAVKSDVEINHKYSPDFWLLFQSKETGENVITGELQVVILHLKLVMKMKWLNIITSATNIATYRNILNEKRNVKLRLKLDTKNRIKQINSLARWKNIEEKKS